MQRNKRLACIHEVGLWMRTGCANEVLGADASALPHGRGPEPPTAPEALSAPAKWRYDSVISTHLGVIHAFMLTDP